MAYVGTPKDLGNQQDNFRSVVLGEAANQGLVGQQAVADVVVNRANAGMYGGTINGNLLAPNQFQGQVDLSRYSPAQIATADQAIANAQNGQDVTGGALYYANPGASSARWATNLNSSNSYQIGDHYFTDNTSGKPFSGPNGTVTPTPVGAASADGTTPQAYDKPTTGNSDASTSTYTKNADGTYQQTSANGVSKAIAATTPIAIATGSDEISGQSAANTKATNDTNTANTKSITDTANSIYGLSFGTLGDGAMRIALVVLGLVLLGGALYLIATEQGEALLKRAIP